jgi:hypothetical protein
MQHSTNSAEPWRVRAVSVREFNFGLRWSLEARRRDGETIVVTADSSTKGTSIDVQSEHPISPELDSQVRETVGDVLAMRDVLRQLPRTEQPLQRSDRLRFGA